MFDPVSVIGIVGTTAGLISFLSTTVERLNDRRNDFENCIEQLSLYRLQVETLHLDLQVWARIWYRDETDSTTITYRAYQYFWGIDGFERVKERLEGIHKEFREIQHLIYSAPTDDGVGGFASLDQQVQWEEMLRNVQSNLPRQPIPRRWMLRFCFALYKNSTLKGKLGNLKDRVPDLEKFSREQFWTLQDQQVVSTPVTSDVLKKLLDTKTGVERLRRFSTSLDCFSSQTGSRWRLIIGKPSLEDGLAQLEEDMDVHIGFVVERPVLAREWAAHIIKLSCSDCKLGPDLLPEMTAHLSVWSNTSDPLPLKCAERNNAIKSFLWKIQHEGDRLRKSSQLLRAKVAMELVNSTSLLHETPWTKALCTCGVHYTDLDNEKNIRTFRTYLDDATDNAEHDCHDSALQSRGLFLLAVALSELAIAAPIRVSMDTASQPELEVLSNPTSRIVNPSQLLRLVGQKTSPKYKRAVNYCFELDRRIEQRGFRPDDLQRCLEYIVKPIETYHSAIVEECQQIGEDDWYQNLQSHYPVPV